MTGGALGRGRRLPRRGPGGGGPRHVPSSAGAMSRREEARALQPGASGVPGVPASAHLGVLGVTGFTAWLGLTKIAEVGGRGTSCSSPAPQARWAPRSRPDAKLKGASRTIGSAWRPREAQRLLTERFGYDVGLRLQGVADPRAACRRDRHRAGRGHRRLLRQRRRRSPGGGARGLQRRRTCGALRRHRRATTRRGAPRGPGQPLARDHPRTHPARLHRADSGSGSSPTSSPRWRRGSRTGGVVSDETFHDGYRLGGRRVPRPDAGRQHRQDARPPLMAHVLDDWVGDALRGAHRSLRDRCAGRRPLRPGGRAVRRGHRAGHRGPVACSTGCPSTTSCCRRSSRSRRRAAGPGARVPGRPADRRRTWRTPGRSRSGAADRGGRARDARARRDWTSPGPFAARTIELGGYVGVRQEGRLVAMAAAARRRRGGRRSAPSAPIPRSAAAGTAPACCSRCCGGSVRTGGAAS